MLVKPGRYSPASRPVHGARRAGEEAEHVGDRGNLIVQRRGERLAAVVGLELGEGGALGFDAIGERSSSAARSLGGVRAQPGAPPLPPRHRRLHLARLASGTSAMHLPLAGSSTRSARPSPRNQRTIDQEFGLHGARSHCPLLLFGIVERQGMGDRRPLEILAAHFQFGAVDRDGDVEARDAPSTCR